MLVLSIPLRLQRKIDHKRNIARAVIAADKGESAEIGAGDGYGGRDAVGLDQCDDGIHLRRREHQRRDAGHHVGRDVDLNEWRGGRRVGILRVDGEHGGEGYEGEDFFHGMS